MTITESLITAAIDWLESAEDFALFDSKMLGRLEIVNELMPYISAILKSIPFYAVSSLKASKRRFLCFQKSITLLKAGKLLEHQGKELLNRCKMMSLLQTILLFFSFSLLLFSFIFVTSLLFFSLLFFSVFFFISSELSSSSLHYFILHYLPTTEQ